MKPELSIIIPNWNGETFIVRGISSLLLSARAWGKSFELIVVDDASTDRAPQLIAETFPDVKLLKNRKNRGFGWSVNRGIRAARAPFVILANNDLVVKEDFIQHLMDPFEKEEGEDLFGISARTVNWTDGSPNHLNMTAHFERGLIELDYEDSPESCSTLFLQGGACSLRRDVFLRLGGFRSIFRPGYWEDYDISYRAAKMGWRLVYEPRALAYHLGKGSLMKVLGKEGIDSVSTRNYFLFTWMNLEDRGMLASHFWSLPGHLFREVFKGGSPRLTRGFWRAVPRLFRVLRERRRSRSSRLISDRTLLS